ncbi:hypothetical protein [Frigoriglobus tundricola]|uniref:Uncharacterized protein n=1 Tax=Frigoriglobus tundricola TaxID=2774151 RepID=A0A6M5Z038_9BACT|nr:hypothetical protein [Frigoriglobus tundricola]QJW98562.1 hypothetical protein FTUN_6157 [Frigoriglobus tundricola]
MYQNYWFAALIALGGFSSSAFSQPPPAAGPAAPESIDPLFNPDPKTLLEGAPEFPIIDLTPADRLRGNQSFQNFIGFMGNPTQNIDPRAVTAFWPVFDTVHTSALPALPSATAQVYGAGVTVALSDRLAFGMNQGGYAQIVLSRNQPGLFPNLQGVLQNRRQYAGLREGWLNLGGFVQYTLIADAERQFLLTAGMRWVAPSGASQLFQGQPPWGLAPYVTVGKEIGLFHVLATTGFSFPAGSAPVNSDFFYLNLHLDRQCFGWFYPLIEFNSTYHTTSASLNLPTRFGFINTDTFSTSGNAVAMAVGANAVLVRNKVELGAVYSTLIASQHGFSANGLLVKMVFRY